MSMDPELRQLYLDARRASEKLVARLESYGEPVPSRPTEAALTEDIAREALFFERQFRDWSERIRSLRETLEDAPEDAS
jgi:hypothetical protein